jgi:prepilin-type N-terminal cleavage/methylation domain-containing protein
MKSKYFRNNGGYTIIELIAVLAIIGIIAAVAVPIYAGSIESAKVKSDKASAQIIAKAMEMKWMDDEEEGEKIYVIDDEMSDYFKQIPKPQASDDQGNQYSTFVAVVDDNGKCTGVYYETDEGQTSLLD